MSKSRQEQYNSLVIPDELYIEDFKNAKVEDAFQFAEWYFAQTKDRINVLKDYISPVSYTHLDVYKRQHCRLRLP